MERKCTVGSVRYVVVHTSNDGERKSVFQLTTHSVHFNIRYMTSDHSDNETGNALLPVNVLLFPVAASERFMHHRTDRIIHTTVFVTPVVEKLLGPTTTKKLNRSTRMDRSVDQLHYERKLRFAAVLTRRPVHDV